MKIQINSLEALERLIKDDKEMEIAVKDSILNGFAKKYLKSVVNSEVMEKLKSAISTELKNTNYLGLFTDTPIFGYPKLSQEAIKSIQSEVYNQFSLTVENKFNELRNELVQNLRSRLDAMAEEVSACIKEDIRKETLEKLVNQKIKKMVEELK